jgi:hypothetical protein
MTFKCPAPGCRSSFTSSVGVYFRLKEEHPAGVDEYRSVLETYRQKEKLAKKDDAEERARKRVASYCRKYHRDLPCGKAATA